MNRTVSPWSKIGSAAAVFAVAAILGVSAPTAAAPAAAAKGSATKRPAAGTKLIKRGQYLVEFGGCHDCHTPKEMSAKGEPEIIPSLLLSGHPANMQLPAPPKPSGPWIASTVGTMTAWAGPWGISYAANLTPDVETGLGNWSERNFIEAMRTGRHMGRGRPILPPMPVDDVGKLTDGDLKAVFAYLRSIPAVKNRVPDPTPPENAAAASGASSGAPSGR